MNNNSMAHVIVLDSLNQDIFVCGMCKSVFNSLDYFLTHKRSQCSLIPVEAKDSAVLPVSVDGPATATSTKNRISTQHQNIKESHCESVTALQCTECGRNFKNIKTLKAHVKSHEIKPYQCLVCGRCFNQNSHLQRHILSHKVWPDSLSETTAKSSDDELLSYSCPYCKIVFSSYHIYRSHLKNHETMKKYKCIQGDCVYFFETVESLLHHMSTDHVTPVYSCYICKKPYISLESIATHQLSHSNNSIDNMQLKQYKCMQCDAVFKKPDKLSLHMLTENHKKMCIHCNKTFASDKRLRLHLQTHRKIKPYQCNVCNSSFHMKKYLTNHMLKHGSKEFKCLVCKSMFVRRDLLQRHMRLHQGTKLYKCPYRETLDCKREFNRQDKLKLHMKSHTEVTSKVVRIQAKINANECSG